MKAFFVKNFFERSNHLLRRTTNRRQLMEWNLFKCFLDLIQILKYWAIDLRVSKSRRNKNSIGDFLILTLKESSSPFWWSIFWWSILILLLSLFWNKSNGRLISWGSDTGILDPSVFIWFRSGGSIMLEFKGVWEFCCWGDPEFICFSISIGWFWAVRLRSLMVWFDKSRSRIFVIIGSIWSLVELGPEG